MFLEQVTALNPLMRHLCAFFEVAGGARQNDIAHIIASTTRQGDNMLDMMLAPLDLASAIIAMPFLSPILLSNLLMCVCTDGPTQEGTLSMVSCSVSSAPLVRYAVAMIPRFEPLRIAGVLSFRFGSDLHSIALVAKLGAQRMLDGIFSLLGSCARWVTMIASQFSGILAFLTNSVQTIATQRACLKKLLSGRLFLSTPTTYQFLWAFWFALFIALVYIPHMLTGLAISIQPIWCAPIGKKMVGSLRKNLLAIWTTLKTIGDFRDTHLSTTIAFFATLFESVFVAPFYMEEIGSGGEEVFAAKTLLQCMRSLIHKPNCLSFSLPCFFVARMQGGIFSHPMISQELGNALIIHSFSLNAMWKGIAS